MKRCFKCKVEKSMDEFYAHPRMTEKLLGKCKDCTKTDVKLNRESNVKYFNEFDRTRYRKNILRMWKLKYSGMRRRINGLGDHSNLVGKYLLPQDEFLNWCEESKEMFMKLYQVWKKSGFIRRNAPSIDRVDNKKGYIVGNMQWITQFENSKKYNL